MAGTLEFGKQRLKTKLQAIDEVIEMYKIRESEYVNAKANICENYQKEILENINVEFTQLHDIIRKRHLKIINDVNANFTTVISRETTIPLDEKFREIISNLLSHKEKVQSIINEESSTNFFQESSKLGLEIEKNLDTMINLQIEQFDEPISSAELPIFSFSLADVIGIAQDISLSGSNFESSHHEFVYDSDPLLLCPSQFQSEPLEIVEKEDLSDPLHSENVSLPFQIEQENTKDANLNKISIIWEDLDENIQEEPDSSENTAPAKPKMSVPYNNLTPLQKYKCIVTYVQSPSNIGLQILDREFNRSIPLVKRYHDELDSSPERSELIRYEDISIGDYYFCKFEVDNCWYRGNIIEKFQENEIKKFKVYFIDYGNTDLVHLENLRILPEQFAKFPQQAFKAYLTNIKPNSPDLSTSEKSQNTTFCGWEFRVTQWIDDVIDAHRLVYGYVISCGDLNDIELDFILETKIVRETASQGIITLTEPQLTLLDEDHVSLRNLLIIGEMALEIGETNKGIYTGTLSFTSNSSQQSCTLPEKIVEENPSNSTSEFFEILGMIQDESDEKYHFADIYQQDGLFSCMFTIVDSPDLFYVNIVHMKSKVLDEIGNEVNQHILENEPQYVPLEVGQPCLAIHHEDNKWYRGIVLEFNEDEENYLVFFVDFGNRAWNMTEHIRPIEKRFLRYPAQAIPCRLAGVKPKNSLEWQPEAIHTFSEMTTFSRIITAFMITQETHERIHKNKVILKENVISVRLHDYDSRQESLNSYLIQRGFADPLETGPDLSISPFSCSDSPDELTGWNPMETDFLSTRNNYEYEDDNIEVAIHGYKQTNANICRYFNTRRGCSRGDSCKYLHQRYQRNLPHQVETSCTDNILDLPPPGSYIYCVISAMESPWFFYIQCPNGNIDFISHLREKINLQQLLTEKYPSKETAFYTMNEEMQEFYNKQTYPVSTGHYLSNGEIVIARSSTQSWNRGRITDPEDVRVFFVDYGFSEVVEMTNIRKLEDQFLFVPFQAVLCSLSNVGKIPGKSEAANTRFKELVSRKNFLARVDSSGEIFSLSLYLLQYENEPQDDKLSSKCVNSILSDEGLVEYFENQTSSPESKEVKIFPG